MDAVWLKEMAIRLGISEAVASGSDGKDLQGLVENAVLDAQKSVTVRNNLSRLVESHVETLNEEFGRANRAEKALSDLRGVCERVVAGHEAGENGAPLIAELRSVMRNQDVLAASVLAFVERRKALASGSGPLRRK